MRIRQVGQRARCDTCAKLSAYRRMAQGDQKSKLEVQAAHAAHIKEMRDDRAVAQRLMHASEDSTRAGTAVQPEQAVLYLSLDGMDQAPC